MSKLTAKLSDGREYEVTSTFMKGDGTEVQLFCEPIKPEPPKEVWANYYPDGKFGNLYPSLDEAKCSARPDGRSHRYILAPEPEPEKKPEEPPLELWVNVHPGDHTNIAYGNYGEAAKNVDRDMGGRVVCYVRRTAVVDGKYPIPKLDPAKKPREWWVVVREVEGKRPVAKLCTSEDEALRMALYEASTNAGKYDVRRMREVEE